MAKGSLQDQFKNLGLANQKQVVKARKARDTEAKQRRKGQSTDTLGDAIDAAESAKKAQDKALNAERQSELQEKAKAAEIRQLIANHRIEERGEETFHFNHQGRVSQLMLSPAIRQSLTNGHLALVGQNDEIDIVPTTIAAKIAERDASWLILDNRSAESDASADDDPYADYPIPDDLTW